MMQLPASVMANTFPFDGVAAEAGALFAGGIQYGGGFGGGLTGNGRAAQPVGVPVPGIGPTPGGDDQVHAVHCSTDDRTVVLAADHGGRSRRGATGWRGRLWRGWLVPISY
jgi:hypothetical protein